MIRSTHATKRADADAVELTRVSLCARTRIEHVP
jgi:hypothetical protein